MTLKCIHCGQQFTGGRDAKGIVLLQMSEAQKKAQAYEALGAHVQVKHPREFAISATIIGIAGTVGLLRHAACETPEMKRERDQACGSLVRLVGRVVTDEDIMLAVKMALGDGPLRSDRAVYETVIELQKALRSTLTYGDVFENKAEPQKP